MTVLDELIEQHGQPCCIGFMCAECDKKTEMLPIDLAELIMALHSETRHPVDESEYISTQCWDCNLYFDRDSSLYAHRWIEHNPAQHHHHDGPVTLPL